MDKGCFKCLFILPREKRIIEAMSRMISKAALFCVVGINVDVKRG